LIERILSRLRDAETTAASAMQARLRDAETAAASAMQARPSECRSNGVRG
jgi:hypothetical protein